MKNVVYKFTSIKTGVLVEKSWSPQSTDGDNYYDRESENYAFTDYAAAAEWLKNDNASDDQEQATS